MESRSRENPAERRTVPLEGAGHDADAVTGEFEIPGLQAGVSSNEALGYRLPMEYRKTEHAAMTPVPDSYEARQAEIEAETLRNLQSIDMNFGGQAPEAETLYADLELDLDDNSQSMQEVRTTAYDEARSAMNTILMAEDAYSEREKAAALAEFADSYPQQVVEMVSAHSMSHQDILGLIEAVNSQEVRAKLLKAFHIPDPGKAAQKSPEELAALIESAQKEAGAERLERDRRQVENFEYVSSVLTDAIAEEFPERTERDAERRWEETELQGKILSHAEIGIESMTSPLVVQLDGRELPGVYKPKRREKIMSKEGEFLGQVRAGIDIGEMAPREALASLIDRALGYDMVPTTILRNGPEGVGSVQSWNIGQATVGLAEGGKVDPIKLREAYRRVGLFDFQVVRSDGTLNNSQVGYDGKAGIIDAGSMLAKRVSHTDGLMSQALEAVHGDPPPRDMQEKTAAFLRSFKTKEALRQGFVGLLGAEEGEAFWKVFLGNLEATTRPDFKLPEPDWINEQAFAYNFLSNPQNRVWPTPDEARKAYAAYEAEEERKWKEAQAAGNP